MARLISADDHVQEHPAVWTSRLSPARWGDRIPHVERGADGIDRWVVDGQPLPLEGVAAVGAVMADRAREPQRWEEVPEGAYVPASQLARYSCCSCVKASISMPMDASLSLPTSRSMSFGTG